MFLFVVALVCINVGAAAQYFNARQNCGLVNNKSLNEASGISASQRNPHILWAHNDSGNKSRIFALNDSAKVVGIYNVKHTENRDWEDICTGTINGNNYIFIGDIGDNDAAYDIKTIYRVAEPQVYENQDFIEGEIAGAEKIKFRYPDGKRDTETLMFDSRTKDIYVVSKREDSVRLYRLAYPQSTTDTNTAEYVATLPLTMITGGDISPDGTEILLKNYLFVYYFQRNTGETISQALTKPPIIISQYIAEPQGEGICFNANGTGFFTISEYSDLNIPAQLYYYSRSANTAADFDNSEYSLENIALSSDNELLYIKFNLPLPADIEIAVTDIAGRIIMSEKCFDLTREKQEIIIPKNKLPCGTYQICLLSGKVPEKSFLLNVLR